MMKAMPVNPESFGRRLLAAVVEPTSLPGGDVGAELAALEDYLQHLEQHTLAANTVRAYENGWRCFEQFCGRYRLDELPAHPETVRWFVAWLATQQTSLGLPRFAVATIRQYLAAVADRHVRGGFLDPTSHAGVHGLVRALAKLRSTRPARKHPLVLADVVAVVSRMEHGVYPDGVSALRDAAAVWLGFAGALRRSEVAGLRLDSLSVQPDVGIYVRVGRSKTDQTNTAPDVVVLPYGSDPQTCPACAVHRWVHLVAIAADDADLADLSSGLGRDTRSLRQQVMAALYGFTTAGHVCGKDGTAGLISASTLQLSRPLLRATYRNRRRARISAAGISGDALGAMLHRRLAEAGYNPDNYGFHSLRSGHVTQARRNGASTEEIMRAGRWQRAETVDVYDREHNPIVRNSVTRLGL